MATKFGFFDAIETGGVPDRVYSSVDFNEYFKGFMGYYPTNSGDPDGKTGPQMGFGKFPNVGDGFKITPGTGLSVVVGTGKALVDYHWYEQDAAESLSIAPNNTGTLVRKDRIVIRSNSLLTAWGGTPPRTVELVVKQGVPAEAKIAQAPKVNIYGKSDKEGVYELSVGIITVKPGAGSIKAGDIISNNNNWIRALLTLGQDLDQLVKTYQTKLDNMMDTMTSWYEAQRNEFNIWFYELSSQLTVGGYIRKFHKYVSQSTAEYIDLDMTDYMYETDDVFIVVYNGLTLTRDTHYKIETASTASGARLHLITSKIGLQSASDMDILVLKTNIAQRIDGTLASVSGEKHLYTTDAKLGRAYAFKALNVANSDPLLMSWSNRNILDFSKLTSDSETDISVTNTNGVITLTGDDFTISSGEETVCSAWIHTRALADEGTYTLSLGGSGDGLGDAVHIELWAQSPGGSGPMTKVAEASVGDPITFATNTELYQTFPDDYIYVKVIVDEGDYDHCNYTIYPMLEYGTNEHDFVSHNGGEFSYYINDAEASNLPSFTDNIVYIWAKENSEASNFQLLYYVISEGNADTTLY